MIDSLFILIFIDDLVYEPLSSFWVCHKLFKGSVYLLFSASSLSKSPTLWLPQYRIVGNRILRFFLLVEVGLSRQRLLNILKVLIVKSSKLRHRLLSSTSLMTLVIFQRNNFKIMKLCNKVFTTSLVGKLLQLLVFYILIIFERACYCHWLELWLFNSSYCFYRFFLFFTWRLINCIQILFLFLWLLKRLI